MPRSGQPLAEVCPAKGLEISQVPGADAARFISKPLRCLKTARPHPARASERGGERRNICSAARNGRRQPLRPPETSPREQPYLSLCPSPSLYCQSSERGWGDPRSSWFLRCKPGEEKRFGTLGYKELLQLRNGRGIANTPSELPTRRAGRRQSAGARRGSVTSLPTASGSTFVPSAPSDTRIKASPAAETESPGDCNGLQTLAPHRSSSAQNAPRWGSTRLLCSRARHARGRTQTPRTPAPSPPRSRSGRARQRSSPGCSRSGLPRTPPCNGPARRGSRPSSPRRSSTGG